MHCFQVEAQELKLRKLRALRGQSGANAGAPSTNANAAVLADLDSIRGLFNEKVRRGSLCSIASFSTNILRLFQEKELASAVRKVEDLTHQLDDLRSGRGLGGGGNTSYPPPQLVELERLRRELAYRKQLNEQQNNMIAQQRAQLSMGQEEMVRIDSRIAELQDRLARKRMMNQQLANQISAATSAKQAQLRAIQGMGGRAAATNRNKPVSTVEPFQRQQSQPADLHRQQQHHIQDKINKNGAVGGIDSADPAKYQTLPYGTKFGQPGAAAASSAKSQKIEQLKQEKENNNVQVCCPPSHEKHYQYACMYYVRTY